MVIMARTHGEEKGMRTQKVAGDVVGEKRIGLVFAGERMTARADPVGKLALLSSAHSRPGD